MQDIPYYVINEPYELFYKNSTAAYPVGAHTHNAAEIYLTLTDLPDVLLNDTVSKVRRGNLILIPPFCVHQLYHEKNICYERYILNLDIQWLKNVLHPHQELLECLSHAERPQILALPENELSQLTNAFRTFLPQTQERSIESTVAFFSMLSVLDTTVHIARKALPVQSIVITKSQKNVNDIIAYIHQHLETEITLNDIAAHFFLNKDYLSRLFMKHTHTTIGRYITIQRITKAQEYLRDGMTVTQVCDKMGFSSYAYFFKVFKKMTGISPSHYRLDALNQQNPQS